MLRDILVSLALASVCNGCADTYCQSGAKYGTQCHSMTDIRSPPGQRPPLASEPPPWYAQPPPPGTFGSPPPPPPPPPINGRPWQPTAVPLDAGAAPQAAPPDGGAAPR